MRLATRFGLSILLWTASNAFGQTTVSSHGNQDARNLIAMDYEQFVSYWTTEPGWHSELQLRNNLPDQDLSVLPILRTADGAETNLPAVIVKPAEVKSIDIGANSRDGTALLFFGTTLPPPALFTQP
jgi:hypothetical protein